MDPYLFFSIIFIVLALLLASYPILGFYFTTYVSSPHDLVPGSSFTYYTRILPYLSHNTTSMYIVRLDFIYVGSEEYIANVTLYKLEDSHGISISPLRRGGFSFFADRVNVLCNTSVALSYQNSSLVRLVMPKATGNVSIVSDVKYLIFEETGSYFGRGLFSPGYPEKYLGFAWVYRGVVVSTASNNSNIAESAALFVHVNEHYLAYQIWVEQPVISQALLNDLGHACPVLHSLVEADRKIASELDYTDEEVIQLNYISIVPSDQAWVRAFWDNFNNLAPLSYALVAMAVILIILRVRRS